MERNAIPPIKPNPTHMQYLLRHPEAQEAVRMRDKYFRRSWSLLLDDCELRKDSKMYEAAKKAQDYEVEHLCNLACSLPERKGC